MKNHNVVLGSILFPLLFFWLGCASTQMQTRQPLEVKLNQYSGFVFSAEASVAEDVKEETTDLEREVMDKVKDLKLFKKTELGDGKGAPEGTLLVKAVITDINKVSGASRFFLGVFAGKASMTIDVTFSDAVTGRVLSSFEVTGKSGGTGVSGGTSEAVEQTAEGIADLISQNYN